MQNSRISGENGCNGRHFLLQHTNDEELNPLWLLEWSFMTIWVNIFTFNSQQGPSYWQKTQYCSYLSPNVSYRDNIASSLTRRDEISYIGKWKLDSMCHACSQYSKVSLKQPTALSSWPSIILLEQNKISSFMTPTFWTSFIFSKCKISCVDFLNKYSRPWLSSSSLSLIVTFFFSPCSSVYILFPFLTP